MTSKVIRGNTKWCNFCKEYKPLSDFTPHRHNTNGYHAFCNPCRRIRVRAQRAGVSVEELQRFLDSQDKMCGICRKVPGTCVDHDHETGRLRGLLCDPCNLLVGWIEKLGLDKVDRLLEYLDD